MKYLTIVLFLLTTRLGLCQNSPTVYNDTINPGVFKLVLSAENTKIKTGDDIEIDVQITGSGNIDFKTVKIFFTTNSDFLNTEETYAKGGFYTEEIQRTGNMVFGSPKMPLVNGGTIVYPYSRFISNNQEYNLFSKTIETNEESIYFEQKYWSESESRTIPALFFHFKTLDNLPSGNYYLTFVFTYFNGENWVNDTEVIDIEVMPWYVEYEAEIQVFAFVIAVLTLTTLIRPVLKELMLFFKNTQKLFFSVFRKIKKIFNNNK